MADFIEVWKQDGMGLVALESGRVAIGKADTNDVCLTDPTVSGLHAVLERYGPGWCIKDLGSRNGTFVNGERIAAERVLKAGDEIRLGGTRLVYRAGAASPERPVTQLADAPPELGGEERAVLLGLCRPVLSGDMFTEPASVAEIATEAGIDAATAEKTLESLFVVFGVEGEGDKRRVKLANEAIRRGAVSIADLRGP